MFCGIDVSAKPDFDRSLSNGCKWGSAATEKHVNTANDR
jgi:hypothetical protein